MEDSEKTARLSILTNVLLVVIKTAVALISGSLAVTADAIHSLSDVVSNDKADQRTACRNDFDIHEENICHCFPWGGLREQWAHCTSTRGILGGALLIFLFTFITDQLGPTAWNRIRVTLVILSALALFIVSTVPDHFLEDHLWDHVVKNHVPKVFLWTFGALLLMQILVDQLHLEEWMQQNQFIILLIACLVGLIPESGPHLMFLTFFVENTIPFSIFLASSVIQDGHGMLPLLAESQRDFLKVEAINFFVGLLVGLTGYASGW